MKQSSWSERARKMRVWAFQGTANGFYAGIGTAWEMGLRRNEWSWEYYKQLCSVKIMATLDRNDEEGQQ